MIAVGGCVYCNQAAQEMQPVGWVRISIFMGVRKPDEDNRRVVQTHNKVLYVCGSCFEEYWKEMTKA